MPHIGVIMERSLPEPRSLSEALRDLFVRSVAAGLNKRGIISDAQNQITDVKTAFSSWDNCMKATFCKWPVIAVIIIGGLIIFSVVWCIIRCACCGLSCCCSCFQCLKCCGNCCGMCDAPNKRHKYLDDPYMPPHHNQGYQAQAPMSSARAMPVTTMSGAVAKPDPPQYAEFDTSKKGAEDALPEMPSWEGANTKKISVGDDVELDDLKKPENAQSAPLMAPGSMSHPPSPNPVSPLDSNSYSTPGYSTAGGYMPPRTNSDPYSLSGSGPQSRHKVDPYSVGVAGQQQGYGNNGFGSYGQTSGENVSTGYGQGYNTQGYGAQGYDSQGYGNQAYGSAQDYDDQGQQTQGYGAAAATMSQGRRTPHQDYNAGGYRQGPGGQGYPQSRTPRPYDEFGRTGTPRSGTPRSGTPGNGAYSRTGPRPSPAPGSSYANSDRMRSPGPQQGGYGNNQRSNPQNGYGRQYPAAPQRQYSSDSARPLNQPEPQRQYTNTSYQQTRAGPYQQVEPPQSPIQNSGGFDFTSGYSRPSPPPQPASNAGVAYPGYRAYQPQ